MNKKNINNIAKTLFKKSITDGLVDENKVRVILKELTSIRPVGLTTILKTYKRLLLEKLSFEEVILETNDRITLQKNYVDEIKKKTGAVRINNQTNQQIVFGAKITHGDWIYDDTLESKLDQIVKA